MHLLTAGLWIGALPLFLAADRAKEHRVVRRFSATASWAVGVFVLTGVVITLLLLQVPIDLVTDARRRLLIAQMVSGAVVLALASVSRWRATAMLERLTAAEGGCFWQLFIRAKMLGGVKTALAANQLFIAALRA